VDDPPLLRAPPSTLPPRLPLIISDGSDKGASLSCPLAKMLDTETALSPEVLPLGRSMEPGGKSGDLLKLSLRPRLRLRPRGSPPPGVGGPLMWSPPPGVGGPLMWSPVGVEGKGARGRGACQLPVLEGGDSSEGVGASMDD